MSGSVRIAVAAAAAVAGDVAGNAALARDAIAQASEAGARLIVLPELMSSGYSVDPALLTACAESVDDPGPALRTWCAAAREFSVVVIAGLAEVAAGRLFNSAVAIGPDGQLLCLYRKLHLFAAERGVFTPGDRGLPLFKVEGFTIGLAVCYDLRFPEVIRILATRGADLIAVPTAWTPGFDAPPAISDAHVTQTTGVLVQANLSQVYVACAGMVGQSPRLLGRSIIVDPFGRAVAGPLGEAESALSVWDMTQGELERARIRTDDIAPGDQRRTDVYGYDLGYRGVS